MVSVYYVRPLADYPYLLPAEAGTPKVPQVGTSTYHFELTRAPFWDTQRWRSWPYPFRLRNHHSCADWLLEWEDGGVSHVKARCSKSLSHLQQPRQSEQDGANLDQRHCGVGFVVLPLRHGYQDGV